MASRIILARISRNSSLAVNRLISARPELRLCGSDLVSSSPIKVPVNQFSTFSALLNGTFQRLGFSSTASPQSNSSAENRKGKESSDEIAKESSEKDPAKAEEATDSDNEPEMSREDLMKLLVEKDELLEEKQKEFETMKDKLIRGYAEMENVMSRTKREAENSKKFAIQSFAKGLLDVADNLERASSVVKESFAKIDENESDKAAPLLKTLLEGVEMTQKQLSEVFKKFGVEKYSAENETFDPHRHNAVFEVPDPSKPPGTVAVVLKNGYMLHERVLRPAEVGVTKSPAESSE
ncbi:grpE protein [Carex littledalei]|uniref:GrpE protein homolog n=1 Tax=Carex littledalei TaxID=544730 RepID=A0A833QZG3_9POAL|nr:grpE protein [Carex littledalei]